jgi:serine O-acetyltransferase
MPASRNYPSLAMEAETRSERDTIRSRRRRQPKFFEAVVADARIASFHSGRRYDTSKRLPSLMAVCRLIWSSDGFLAQVVYRFGARMWGLRVPVLPRVARGITMLMAQMSISDTVIMEPGVSISHGYVCIGGLTEIRSGTLVAPFVSIGLVAGDIRGPTIGRVCTIGTGARLLGPIEIGDRAQVGANAVVLADVPADAIAVGVPARLVDDRDPEGEDRDPGAQPDRR